jgi:GT2 family glycosyltransferase
MNNLSVIIPSRTLSNLTPCAEAVARHEESVDTIVAWDRSNGNEWLPPTPDYRVREVETPFIYARNCNIGMACAGDNDVILLNDDALLRTPDGFTAMQRQAQEHPEFGIIGAVTNVTGQPLQQPQGIGLREVEHFAFVCVLIPRRTINAVGLLDERYCLDYGVEDRDYCEAVRRMGLKCGVYDHCFVDHSQLKSTFRGEPTASRSYARNWSLFCQKWGMSA